MNKNEQRAMQDLRLYTNFITNWNSNNKNVQYKVAPIINDRFYPFDLIQVREIDTITGMTLSTSIVELKSREIPSDKYNSLLVDFQKVQEMQRYMRSMNCLGYIVAFFTDGKMSIHSIDKDFNYDLNSEMFYNIPLETCENPKRGDKMMTHLYFKDAKILDYKP